MVTWNRPETVDRQSAARFRARWDDTINLLTREVEHLDGGHVVVEARVDPSQIRRDGMLRASARVTFPGVRLWFASRHGPLEYATDAYDHWQANIRAIALALQALRAVDRYGVTRTGEQYRGWTQLAATSAESGMTIDEAALVLATAAQMPGSTILGSVEAVQRAYKAAARTAHPDAAGGSADAFRLITTARDVLLEQRFGL